MYKISPSNLTLMLEGLAASYISALACTLSNPITARPEERSIQTFHTFVGKSYEALDQFSDIMNGSLMMNENLGSNTKHIATASTLVGAKRYLRRRWSEIFKDTLEQNPQPVEKLSSTVHASAVALDKFIKDPPLLRDRYVPMEFLIPEKNNWINRALRMGILLHFS